MTTRIRRLILLIFLLTIRAFIYSQETRDNQPLITILNELQDRFAVQFNYATETVEDIFIKSPQASWDLERNLSYLAKSTGLRFNVLSNKIVTILRSNGLLCGYLKDKDTGEAIVFATIRLANTTVTSNSEGYFELERTAQEDIAQIRHVGYKTLERQLYLFKGDNCGDIYLVPDQQQLAEVVVYDYLTRGIDKLNNGAYTIDFNQFTILPGLIENDVLQSVQAFPGIQSINETVSNINIRGGSHDQNLILWDGIKMYQSGHFFGLISMYNPQITQRVTLRKNGSPVGLTDGVSGTISMETDRDINNKAQGNLGINFLDASGFADIPLGDKSSF